VTPEQLFKAVQKHLEAEAFAAEQAQQTRRFTSQERVAFKCGFYRGMVADVHRASPAVWNKAAKDLTP
jgi:hypothetical protein